MGKSKKTGKTLVDMVTGLSAVVRFPYVCHTVELSVKKGFDIPEISCVLMKTIKSVTHFNRSIISLNKLKELSVLL